MPRVTVVSPVYANRPGSIGIPVHGVDVKVVDRVKDKRIEELPDYEVSIYFENIDKIPYTPNDKQDFVKLETMGNEIVKKKKIIRHYNYRS